MDCLFTNIKSLIGIRQKEEKRLSGQAMKELPQLPQAWLAVRRGRISAFGKMEDTALLEQHADLPQFDCSGRILMPCWCDSHTHLVFAAWRAEEFELKIKGFTYEQIAAQGGGILNSARKLSDTDEEILYEQAWQRLTEIIDQGTGAVEIKSGYGLSVEGELKMLRVIARLKASAPIPIKATFLGAHALPAEYRHRRQDYIRLILEEMLPRIADAHLADYCDVFCENGFFTPEETDQILQAAWKYGLKPKIHANQLARSGGVQAGVRNYAVSVDHLEQIDEEEISALQASSTIATLLPAAAFFLRLPYPPARRMLEAGLTVALASDYNPGSCPSGRMSFVVSLACIQMRMTPAEAINAATLNGACAMELEDELGSITIGKRANLILTKPISSVAEIPYRFGIDLIEKVFIS
ncbi:MAG: imidazolonepropionase [Chitinophagales bacterium]|nr:imidazolonepropionase [Chitinophagales bacterium]MDW8428266.1 imidazolonepropionase [Chitinophagales bacterium]